MAHRVNTIVQLLRAAMQADYVVLGGGNARLLTKLPPRARFGKNAYAFRGGYRLWTARYSGYFRPIHPLHETQVYLYTTKIVDLLECHRIHLV
jgi:hypothetical protein